MGQVFHGSATTTEAVRRIIQNGKEGLRARSVRYGINPKIVTKWRKRASLRDSANYDCHRVYPGSRCVNLGLNTLQIKS